MWRTRLTLPPHPRDYFRGTRGSANFGKNSRIAHESEAQASKLAAADRTHGITYAQTDRRHAIDLATAERDFRFEDARRQRYPGLFLISSGQGLTYTLKRISRMSPSWTT